jgi:hypothetical protein
MPPNVETACLALLDALRSPPVARGAANAMDTR